MSEKDFQTLIFLHIPKAAGTTLHQVLERQFHRKEVFTVDGAHVPESIEEFKNLSEEKKAKIKCLKGHLPFGLHENLPGKSKYITVLRNPVDRVISHYYFVLQTPKHYLYRQVASKNLTLEQYVKGNLSSEINNGQTRLICGDPRVDTVSGNGPVSQATLEAAKRNLQEHFIGVGISERFDETVLMFRNLLGWENAYYAKENVTRNRSAKPDVAHDVIKAIEETNALDIELYAFGKELFFDLLKKHGADQEEVKAFKKWNRYFGMAYNLSMVGIPKKVVRRFIKIYKENTVWRKS
ncbi:MAG TPA: sulfotransferase family 2 domain-containing protein [Nitrospiria bacterium]